MQGKTGIWIDHKEAFIAAESGLEEHVRFTGHHSSHEGGAEDKRERHLATELAKYYDEVIAHVRDAESIFLFGPGEAKGELEKRLASAGLAERIVGVETADKMTHHQVAAKVREHYLKNPPA